jgi:hypothetical protein
MNYCFRNSNDIFLCYDFLNPQSLLTKDAFKIINVKKNTSKFSR